MSCISNEKALIIELVLPQQLQVAGLISEVVCIKWEHGLKYFGSWSCKAEVNNILNVNVSKVQPLLQETKQLIIQEAASMWEKVREQTKPLCVEK